MPAVPHIRCHGVRWVCPHLHWRHGVLARIYVGVTVCSMLARIYIGVTACGVLARIYVGVTVLPWQFGAEI